jgi:hypothetical protein
MASKREAFCDDAYLLVRIQSIQQELEQLRKALTHQVEGHKRKTKLKGLWKGVKVTDADLEEAKRAVFKMLRSDHCSSRALLQGQTHHKRRSLTQV